MRLTDLTKKTRKIEVSYLGETAEVEYRLAAVTPQFMAEIRGMDSIDSIMHQIEMTVVRWDLTDENGMEIPPTVKDIQEKDVPVGFLSQVLNCISDDMGGWEKSEKKG